MKVQELFEPGEYLDQRGPGFFSILSKPTARAKQDSYELSMLPTVVKHVDPDIDTWITQAVFSERNRRSVNMHSVGLLFVDLDTYHVPELAEKSPEAQAHLLATACERDGIPAPSIILFSGRGLQAKWLLTDSLGPVSLHDWNEAQLALVKSLEGFAADRAARDISRVLRLEHTTNTKSKEKCRVVYTSSNSEVLARYEFEALASLLTERYKESPLEDSRPTVATEETNSHIIRRAQPGFNFKRLNWFRYYDLDRLWKLRGGVPVGYREATLFWMLNFLLRAEPVRIGAMWAEAQSLAKKIDPSKGWWNRSDLSSLYAKAKQFRDGATVKHHGKEYPPLYNPQNSYLIDLFKIEPGEEREMKTVISNTEKYRRKVEKRRASGIRPREEYEAGSTEKQKPWVAEGISRRWWYEKRRRAKE